MTSAASSRRPTRNRRPPAGPCAPGLTLVEICLGLVLIALLMTMLVVSMPSLTQSQVLEEGAGRFESVIHMARADAANLGRKLRLSFEGDDDGVVRMKLLWEADPLGAPRQFTAYTACTWLGYVPYDLVEVTSCKLQGAEAFDLAETLETEESSTDERTLDPVTFYPDGSCDSAYITLAALNSDDPRTAVIEIEGLSGLVTRRILTSDELAEEAETDQ